MNHISEIDTLIASLKRMGGPDASEMIQRLVVIRSLVPGHQTRVLVRNQALGLLHAHWTASVLASGGERVLP